MDVQEGQGIDRVEYEVVHDVDAVLCEGCVLLEVDVVREENGGGHKQRNVGTKGLRQVCFVQENLNDLEDEVRGGKLGVRRKGGKNAVGREVDDDLNGSLCNGLDVVLQRLLEEAKELHVGEEGVAENAEVLQVLLLCRNFQLEHLCFRQG